MSIVNKDFIRDNICSNNGSPVAYRWSHGATEEHLGDGILIYSIIQMMRYKNLICLGSGGGFIPRIMTQARLDLFDQSIFEGNKDINYGDIGVTYLVDAVNSVGGNVDYDDDSSFYRTTFCPRFIKDTTENAYYNFFVKQDIKADFIHIDADHSYEGVKKDFELYSKILSKNGMISIHDTDISYIDNFIVSEDNKHSFTPIDGPSKLIKEITSEWKIFNFFNHNTSKNKPSSTGITLIQRA